MIALIVGGARSGKSRYAAQVAGELSASPVMLATSRYYDDDHAARIARHKADRGPEWTTLEEDTVLAHTKLAGRVVVVDCVTLWLTNLFIDRKQDADAALGAARAELARVVALNASFLFVSNELGMSPHAATEVGRKFVDLQGRVNQDIAALARAVTLMVAGIPLPAKGGDVLAALSSGDP